MRFVRICMRFYSCGLDDSFWALAQTTAEFSVFEGLVPGFHHNFLRVRVEKASSIYRCKLKELK